MIAAVISVRIILSIIRTIIFVEKTEKDGMFQLITFEDVNLSLDLTVN